MGTTGTPPYTAEQLANSAKAIAYRAEQLSGVAQTTGRYRLVGRRRDTLTVNNALIESGLSSARALAEFFCSKEERYARAGMFRTGWSDPVRTVAGRIYGEVTKHLGHATVGAPEGEPHPGDWPLEEMALTLVSAIRRFVASLDSETAGLFLPSPERSYMELLVVVPDNWPLIRSDNPGVVGLTEQLRIHLDELDSLGLIP